MSQSKGEVVVDYSRAVWCEDEETLMEMDAQFEEMAKKAGYAYDRMSLLRALNKKLIRTVWEQNDAAWMIG